MNGIGNRRDMGGRFGTSSRNHSLSFDEVERQGVVKFNPPEMCQSGMAIGISSSSDCLKIASVLASALTGEFQTEIKDNGAIVSARPVRDRDAKEGIMIEVKNDRNEAIRISAADAKEAITVLNGLARNI